MNFILRKILILVPLIMSFNHIYTMNLEIDSSSILFCTDLGTVKLFYNEPDFYVEDGLEIVYIKDYLIDTKIKNISKDLLEELLRTNYLVINKLKNGELAIKVYPRKK